MIILHGDYWISLGSKQIVEEEESPTDNPKTRKILKFRFSLPHAMRFVE